MGYELMRQRSKIQTPSYSWKRVFILTTVIAYAYVFSEWLFMITKPSYMSMISFTKKVEVFLFTGSLVAGGSCLILLVLLVIGLLPFINKHQKVMLMLGGMLPVGIMACALLLLVDNFTYTLFNYGIVSTEGYFRGLYALGFLIVFAFCLRYLSKKANVEVGNFESHSANKHICLILWGVILLSFFIPVILNDFGYRVVDNSISQIKDKPNIIYITADGVNAINMSVYGYERDTTPRLRQLAETSLVAENAFTNSGNTAGSLISAFTGKYPTTTRVLYPPNILRDDDAYQHLPGILWAQGYYTVQMSVPHYGDAYTLNLLNGFDEANGREMIVSTVLTNISQYMPTDFAYFIYEIGNRISDRIRHIFYIKVMSNPVNLEMSSPDDMYDQMKIDDAIKIIRKSNKPFFIHIHIMGTHGDLFYPQVQIFSKGQDVNTQTSWDIDFYDDCILRFDRQVGEIVDALKKKQMLNDTILIISSDHGQKFVTTKRIPLIIHFPDGQYAGRITNNAQVIDIAPTILDYMGMDIPEWIQGQSLLNENLPQRPIFGVKSNQAGKDEFGNMIVQEIPNFNQFGIISLAYCQKYYLLNLLTFKWYSGDFEGYIAPCNESELITEAEAFRLMREHLSENGYDTTPLDEVYMQLISSK